ncbi:PTS system, mannose/fructose/sorbose-specific IID component [Enterococcus faecium]|nr:PTS system, mannose/fructose/sorbose-specific IID component [Enterococcus faecium]
MGANAIEKAFENNYLESFSLAASIVGLMSIGAMTSSLVRFTIPAVFKSKGGEINVQQMLDDIFPGILSLGLTFFVYFLLKKKVKVLWIILAIFVFSIVGVYIGLLG